MADITPPAVANARKEIADMQAVIDEQKGGFQLASWDWDLSSESNARVCPRLSRVSGRAVCQISELKSGARRRGAAS